jgi:hypothetical protein
MKQYNAGVMQRLQKNFTDKEVVWLTIEQETTRALQDFGRSGVPVYAL